ncbi:PucR C-terminal helix-turn-helix domain-containing protein [Nocardioides alpinus]|uniref:CdaR family transcriptional regulator n=2 Tax=Nocardioides TaxID=1839 RepID=A0A4Q2SII9_9ACTN|nr:MULTISPECIES: helix-turn-helix domain-containing protein [Nocardioides]PKH38499.1 CdaR family transcriptional regulator [Nocardioides alpinus]RYC05356.1 CdaR family transcriptional regulator [Nocardioides zhouii]SFB47700.1 PucR C-terminal helix-turn-helix domain-containing protein [Nocardioides alpinus]
MTIETDLRAVADAVRARIPELVSAIERMSLQEVPEIHEKDDPVLAEAERPSIISALTSIIDGLARGRRPPDRASDAALQEARVAAQAGIDLHSLLRTYRVGQSILWDVILEETLRAVDSDEQRITILRQASDYQYAWNNKVTESVIATYQAEHNAYFFRSQDRKRRAVVSDILRGVPADVQQLGYSLRAGHLAVVAWGRSPEANIRALAVALDARHLTVSGTSGTYLGWLGSSALYRVLEARPESIRSMPETHLALGDVEHGIEGFRLSHRQAWQAYRVGRLRASGVVRYGDVALESLVLKDRQAVHDFVSRELGALHEEDSRGELLKATLQAYFQCGQNAASTAQAIHVHERTVAYRLRSIESRLGVTISDRRDELAVALRLANLFNQASDNELQDLDEHADAGLGPDPDAGSP